MQNSMALFTLSGFYQRLLFCGKFGPKIQNYLFKVKFGTKTNSNMQNSMVMFTFFVFKLEIPFLS